MTDHNNNTNCKSCYYCYSCDSCDSCNYCNSCISCDSCNYCYSCNYCNSCISCNSCDFSKNLKMTAYNLFCYSEDYNDENSFQQKSYRAFNKEVGEYRYYEIRSLVYKIIPNPDKLKLTDFWKTIDQDQWQELLAIPEANDFKEGFEFISDCKIENRKEKESEIEHQLSEKFAEKYKIKDSGNFIEANADWQLNVYRWLKEQENESN